MVIHGTITEKLEDELDAEICHKALKNYEENPKTYSLNEIKKELGLL